MVFSSFYADAQADCGQSTGELRKQLCGWAQGSLSSPKPMGLENEWRVRGGGLLLFSMPGENWHDSWPHLVL